MSKEQDNSIVNETKSKEEDTRDNNDVALECSTFGGWKDNTKFKKKNNKEGKVILGQPSTPKKTSQDSNFIAQGQQMVLNPQKIAKPNEYTLGGGIQDMVDDLGTSNTKKKKETQIEDIPIETLDKVDDENLTNRAIRACLAAEATIVALREECNLLPTRAIDEKPKNGHARRGCNCLGKGATCNAAVSLQLQLAACENLSLAATAAFRELVAARLGVTMPTPSASRSDSPKKQRKKPKKPKNETPSAQVNKNPFGLQSGSSPRKPIFLTKRKSTSACDSLTEEQVPPGPFNCTNPVSECVPQTLPQRKTPSACNHPPIMVAPERGDCFPGMFNLQSRAENVDYYF